MISINENNMIEISALGQLKSKIPNQGSMGGGVQNKFLHEISAKLSHEVDYPAYLLG